MAILGKKGKKDSNYLSAKESRRISRENRKITDAIEKQRNRKHIPREEYVTKMRDPNNIVEFDNLHTYFFTDIGTVKSVDGVSFDIRKERQSASSASPDAESRSPAFL